MLAADYQTHTYHSHDGLDSIRAFCLRAIELGFDEIGFSEHKDFDPDDPVVDHFVYDRYAEDIARARAEFSGRLTIRMGVEVDYQRWFEDEIATYLNAHPFDYVIGSVHYVDRVRVMDACYTASRDARTAYRDYFRAVRESIESGQIDILGHLEYPNVRGIAAYGPYDASAYREELGAVLDALLRRGVALEINTAAARKGAGVTFPCPEVVAWYAQRGGRRLTFGSDAHRPEDLGSGWSSAHEIARAAGLTEVTVYEARIPAQRPL
jgi:histidinol-phosphatase (PHP family)